MHVARSLTSTTAAVLVVGPFQLAAAQTTKRGLAYYAPSHRNDFVLLFSPNSTISWIYTWGPTGPSFTVAGNGTSADPLREVEFLPMVHGNASIPSDLRSIQNLSPQPRRILSFNEPDGSVESGGSAISPHDAAQAYLRYFLPLRSRYLISHPSVTGSGNGLNWLQAFNTSCYRLNPGQGCPSDFVAAHFYGDFPALASWIGTLHEFYLDASTNQSLPIWITEMALPTSPLEATEQMFDQTVDWLDASEWVQGYAWFGLFRTDEANRYAGPNVSMLDDQGRLTQIGAEYLGGSARGFAVGDQGKASDGVNGAGPADNSASDLVTTALWWILLVMTWMTWL